MTTPKVMLPPVIAVEIFRNDVRLIRQSVDVINGGGVRQKCTQISQASIKNAKHVIANSEPNLPSIITLTYPETFPHDGRILKAHWQALKERIKRKFGDFSYFVAVEYQERGAPHLHVATSIDLEALGQIDTLKRGYGRRSPTFKTNLKAQNWLFCAWLDVISPTKERRIRDGSLVWRWSGLSPADCNAMETAYYRHNSGQSWEVMRLDDGAKRYLVKELSALKGYQKDIPDGYDNPGRHFLYSPDLKPVPILALEASESLVREILEGIGWKWLPAANRPLYRDLWNVATEIVTGLLSSGMARLEPDHLKLLRKHYDLRVLRFSWGDIADAARWANNARNMLKTLDHWHLEQERIRKKIAWELATWGSV